jgi:Na+-driven multidrug efflux pump
VARATPAIAMRALWFANWLNIVLDPCLIFGLGPFPELGVTGAAIATNLGRGAGVLYQLYRLAQPGGRFSVSRRHLRLAPEVMLRLAAAVARRHRSIPDRDRELAGAVRILTPFGSAALAGYTIALASSWSRYCRLGA